jgi:hypothetical protein
VPDSAQTTPVPNALDGTRPVSVMHLVMAPGATDLTATLPGMPAAVAIARQLAREALTGCSAAVTCSAPDLALQDFPALPPLSPALQGQRRGQL